jgi:2-dehydro-3-deoxyphosphogluconate aldolase/(4S)-4-hydroxy-2-oxoglutarate aldolase
VTELNKPGARPGNLLAPRQPIAIVRLPDLAHAVSITRALVEGGMRAIEFTLTNRTALAAIAQVRAALNEQVRIGAGTVLNAEDARSCILAGAQFLVTPAYLPAVIDCGREHGISVVCGAFTPTEILAAWQAGADLVKVFPVGRLGPSYIKDIRGPLPDIPLIPTGGVDLHNCGAFLDAGAYTVGVGSSLVSEQLVSQLDWRGLTVLADQFVRACSTPAND